MVARVKVSGRQCSTRTGYSSEVGTLHFGVQTRDAPEPIFFFKLRYFSKITTLCFVVRSKLTFISRTCGTCTTKRTYGNDNLTLRKTSNVLAVFLFV